MITQMLKAAGKNSKQNAPKPSSDKSRASKHLPEYERCWCCGFNIGCGFVRSWKMCQRHAVKERKARKGNYDKITSIEPSDH
jgi:hypothetical protein